jgi:glycosyltransferase involved in cell wall biosynthesis
MVNLAEDFYKNNFEVILVTQYKREDEYDINPKIRRVYSEPDETMLNDNRLHNFYIRFKTLRDIWTAYKPDIILSFLGKNNLMAIATSSRLPVKTVVSVRGEPTMEYGNTLMRMLAKFMFRFADGVVLQTRQSMNFFPKKVQQKAVIMPNPLNPAFLNRRYTGQRQDVIVTVGRLDENKNQAMLIHAFSHIASEFPNMNLVIYGDGECKEKLEDLVRSKNLMDRVTLPGSISDVPGHIYDARIFALTSNTEGMPNTIIEAMALGIPVISTDCPCGGPAELIEDGVNGLLVPVGDAFALADAFRKVLVDTELEHKLQENASKITQKLAPDKVNKEWRDYLNSI